MRTRTIPDWIVQRVPSGERYRAVRRAVDGLGLSTVCAEARCPNTGDCLCRGSAAFLILGRICARGCRYCAIETGAPIPPDPTEPDRVARAVAALSLRHVVITSVTRDDLPDGGAGAFAETITRIRERAPGCAVEVLVPDFRGSREASLERVTAVRPDIINHNIEVARPRYHLLRPNGDYDASLALIRRAAASGIRVKSGLMVGFGETLDDIDATLADLRAAGCGMLTVGQYLRSRRECVPVARFYPPEEFEEIARRARGMGFPAVHAAPLARSSHHAEVFARSFPG